MVLTKPLPPPHLVGKCYNCSLFSGQIGLSGDNPWNKHTSVPVGVALT